MINCESNSNTKNRGSHESLYNQQHRENIGSSANPVSPVKAENEVNTHQAKLGNTIKGLPKEKTEGWYLIKKNIWKMYPCRPHEAHIYAQQTKKSKRANKSKCECDSTFWFQIKPNIWKITSENKIDSVQNSKVQGNWVTVTKRKLSIKKQENIENNTTQYINKYSALMENNSDKNEIDETTTDNLHTVQNKSVPKLSRKEKVKLLQSSRNKDIDEIVTFIKSNKSVIMKNKLLSEKYKKHCKHIKNQEQDNQKNNTSEGSSTQQSEKRKPTNQKKNKIEKLKIYYSNVDTLTNKMEELKDRIAIHEPDVIMLTEVLPKHYESKPTENSFKIKATYKKMGSEASTFI